MPTFTVFTYIELRKGQILSWDTGVVAGQPMKSSQQVVAKRNTACVGVTTKLKVDSR